MVLNFPFRRFLHFHVNGGVLLMITALLALVVANSPLNDAYQALWQHQIALQIGSFNFFNHGGHPLTLMAFINDALMAIFFFSVGLEIKREVLVGELSSFRKALLPIVAAVGGMVLPVLIFFFITKGTPAIDGMAIPMATDIAFSLGVLSLFGKRVPLSLKIFLTAFAVVDDIGGVLVIALFYTSHLDYNFLIYSAALLFVLMMCNYRHVCKKWVYVLGAMVMWYFFMQSGVHATIAGVLVAFTVPAKPRAKIGHYVKRIHECIEMLPDDGRDKMILSHEQIAALHNVKSASNNVVSPLQTLEDRLSRPVNYLIMPLFAFANAGVVLTSADGSIELGLVTLAVALGLIVGKFFGIYLFTWLVVKFRLASLGDGMTWKNLTGICLLGGIGFTVSLFIANLSFGNEPLLLNQAKMGVIMGTVISGILGYIVLSLTMPKHEITEEKSELGEYEAA